MLEKRLFQSEYPMLKLKVPQQRYWVCSRSQAPRNPPVSLIYRGVRRCQEMSRDVSRCQEVSPGVELQDV